MVTLKTLGKKLSSRTLTGVEASQAVRLFRRLESRESDPAKKEQWAESRKRFKALASLKARTSR